MVLFDSLDEIKKIHVRWQIMAVSTVFIAVVIWLSGLSAYFQFTDSSLADIKSNYSKLLWLAGLALLVFVLRSLGAFIIRRKINCPACHKRIFTGQRPEVAVKFGVCPYCNEPLLEGVQKDDPDAEEPAVSCKD